MCVSISNPSSAPATNCPPPPPPPPPPPELLHFFDVFTKKQPPPHQQHLFSCSEIVTEAKSLFSLAFPTALTALIIYSRSIISMFFLGRLGDMELAAGSLAIAFANITGYSVLSGLALGMEPLCSQAFGAHRPKLLSLALHRAVTFLLVSSLPTSLLWVKLAKILIFLRQDPSITEMAQTYLIFSLPDLVTNSLINPIRIYLRAQGITVPFTLASLGGALCHVPINFLLVSYFEFGVAGVAASAAASNFLVLVFVVVYVVVLGVYAPTWTAPSRECLSGWKPFLELAAPSCISVCLEWWWYEIMIVLCGLLVDAKATVASMGVLIQTTSLIYIFPSSLGFAVSTRVGNELGGGRPQKAKLSAVVAVFVAAMMGLGATSFATGMRNKWARMFTDDSEILKGPKRVNNISQRKKMKSCKSYGGGFDAQKSSYSPKPLIAKKVSKGSSLLSPVSKRNNRLFDSHS